MTVGKFAITGYFDSNVYSHDPRTQFMNWSLMYNGAWDYPADVLGYAVGTVQELILTKWSLRAAMVLEPMAANGPTPDTRVSKSPACVPLLRGSRSFSLRGQVLERHRKQPYYQRDAKGNGVKRPRNGGQGSWGLVSRHP